jgi:hypothetical protein
MQASTAFGQTAVDFVSPMATEEVVALPLHGINRSLIRGAAILHLATRNGLVGCVSAPAVQDLRAVAEAHCRMNLHGAPVINVLRSTLDLFIDTWVLSHPHGQLNGGLPAVAEPNMEVAMHLMAIVQTPEQRRDVYDGAVQGTLCGNATLLLDMTPEMAANAPVVNPLAEAGHVQEELALIRDLYIDIRTHIDAGLDSLQGMQLTRYRFKTILHEMVADVLVVILRGLFERLAFAYHQGLVSIGGMSTLMDELVEQHQGLLDNIVDRLKQRCSDANVFLKHHAAPIGDDPTFDGTQLAVHMAAARAAAVDLEQAFHGVMDLAIEAAGAVAAAAGFNHFVAMMDDDAAAPLPEDIAAAVDAVMAQATVVQVLEGHEDCAVCMAPTTELVLCHGCGRCHCCVACTRHIVQTNLHGHCCPVCRSRAFPVPLPNQQ